MPKYQIFIEDGGDNQGIEENEENTFWNQNMTGQSTSSINADESDILQQGVNHLSFSPDSSMANSTDPDKKRSLGSSSDSAIAKIIKNNPVVSFILSNQYLFVVWLMIVLQLILVIFLLRSYSFIDDVRTQLDSGGSLFGNAKQVHRSMDLEETAKISQEAFLKLAVTCRSFMCFDKEVSEFGSECLCFSGTGRTWDKANETCVNNLGSLGGKLAVFDTDAKQSSLEAILGEYFSSRPSNTQYGYYGPKFWVGAMASNGFLWKWVNGKSMEKSFTNEDKITADCLAIRGDGYLEPKSCWPSYRDVEIGVLCEKKISKLTVPSQKIQDNQTCDYYGKTNDTLLIACSHLKKYNLTKQIFCNHQEGVCYAYLTPHQLSEADYFAYDRRYYGNSNWLENRAKCKEELGMTDLAVFDDLDEQTFVLNKIIQDLNHLDYLHVGCTKFAVGDFNTWKWVNIGEPSLDQKDFRWIPGNVIQDGKTSHCLAIELNSQKVQQYLDYDFKSWEDNAAYPFVPDYPNTYMPWYEFLDFACTEQHSFVCEFNPNLNIGDEVEKYPLSYINMLLEKINLIFCLDNSNWCFFVPEETANIWNADKVCQHSLANSFSYTFFPAMHAVIFTEEERDAVSEKLKEYDDLIPDHFVTVAAHFNWTSETFYWDNLNDVALDISHIEGIPFSYYSGYSGMSRNDYDSTGDTDSWPLLAFEGFDKSYKLKSYAPPRYSYFYRNGYKAQLLCRVRI